MNSKKIIFGFVFFSLVLTGSTVTASQPRVSVTPTSTTLAQSGASQSFSIALDEPILTPNPNDTPFVTLTITSSDPRAVAYPSTITYTSNEWLQQKSFTVTRNDSIILNSDSTATITVSATSNSEYYNEYTTTFSVNLPNDYVAPKASGYTSGGSCPPSMGYVWNPVTFTCSKIQTNQNTILQPSSPTEPQIIPPSSHHYLFTRTLAYGMKGDDVVALQKILGITPTAKKFFGYATKSALVDFQKKHHLIADGIAGQATEQFIGEIR